MRIGVLGATGPAGRGLAARLADVGYDVLAGSRERAKAEAVVDELRAQWGSRVAGLTGANNQAACDADVVVLAVQADAALATAKYFADDLGGKIVVSMANNLVRNGSEFNAVLPPHGSIAKEMQALLWRSRVVTAFHLVPAAEFVNLDENMEGDVVACGDDDEARRILMEIIADIPDLRAFDGGSLENAVGMETFAAVLLTINIRHKGKAGLRLSGISAGPTRS
ncbi:MAG TPA: NADPH-dependent F420 reductase [Acidimicrobiia bacterium]|nr:NADPH-dependent F420 reductase [Acidimicrobiia bacterium]